MPSDQVIKNRYNKHLKLSKLTAAVNRKEKEIDCPVEKHENKAHSCIEWRSNFMKLVTGHSKFTNKNFLKHINYCTIDTGSFFDAGYRCCNCICGVSIKKVFIVHYYNPENKKAFCFNSGCVCIENNAVDKLMAESLQAKLTYKKSEFTCRNCNKICLKGEEVKNGKLPKAENKFNLAQKLCNQCMDKNYCDFCSCEIESWKTMCSSCYYKEKLDMDFISDSDDDLSL